MQFDQTGGIDSAGPVKPAAPPAQEGNTGRKQARVRSHQESVSAAVTHPPRGFFSPLHPFLHNLLVNSYQLSGSTQELLEANSIRVLTTKLSQLPPPIRLSLHRFKRHHVLRRT